MVEGINLQKIADTVLKTQSLISKIPNFEIEDESTFKKLSGGNCIIRDGSAKM